MKNVYIIIDKPDNRLLGVLNKFTDNREDNGGNMTETEKWKYISYESDIHTCLVDCPEKALENFREIYPNAILLSLSERESRMGYTHKIIKEDF